VLFVFWVKTHTLSSWFRHWFSNKKNLLEETDPMKKFLIAGLGNIGDQYTGTRHNIGFQILDILAREEEFSFESGRLGDIGTFRIKGRSLLCLKPSTYMNRSGKAVRYWLDREKIPLENLLVITDDLNLPFGTLRLKTKGSDGGHNGLSDIQNVLGTTRYARFRFGIGSEYAKGRQVDYVLGRWNETEAEQLPDRLKRSTALIRSFVLAGAARTMNEFNGT
jgi:PTH1 family peptidyl-tRNA hydrolase